MNRFMVLNPSHCVKVGTLTGLSLKSHWLSRPYLWIYGHGHEFMHKLRTLNLINFEVDTDQYNCDCVNSRLSKVANLQAVNKFFQNL